MLPIRTILHPTDFSKNSEPAWEMACALARDYGAELHLIHVEPRPGGFTELGAVPPPPVDTRRLEQQIEQIVPTTKDIEVSRELLEGDPGTVIVQYAKDHQADLLVMGTHGRTGLGRLLMGSVAEIVMRQSPCPVLTVKQPLALHPLVQPMCEVALTP